jgi:hypothetical protein
MKHIEDVEGEGTLWPCDGRWEAMESQELDVICGTPGCIMAGTVSNVGGVYTRKINDNEVFLNGTGAGTSWAIVTKLDH